ncbi:MULTISPECIES: bifunctional UDP-sugar hydrolase/5'-nucleotidase [Myxococcaceae]|uniref:bifunctional metallophosphatase/5'-nucleotidase n=1 Tax=Myxococcaceae TaxID=31 RepID=UPI001E5E1C2E|nr:MULTISPECIES: bifunctional UDP-sugar hydrolase/5'-nucleotidase [Myxococcaceae]
MPVLDGQDTNLAGQDVRLTLLHTSDIHSRLIPYDFAPLKTDTDLGIIPEAGPFGGATRIAALLKRERAKSSRVLHLDSGDCFQGAPIFNLNSGEAEFRFLSQVGLNSAVVGNHEFDAGALNFSNKARDFATFPLLAANYQWEDPREPGSNQTAYRTEPYTIHNVQGLKVAVIGMANISSLNSLVEGGNSMQATPLEQNEIARAYVDLLRPVVDLVVIVSHLGLTEDQDLIQGYTAYYEWSRAKEFVQRKNQPWTVLERTGDESDPKSVVKVRIPGVVGIDVVLGGHLHVVLNPPQTVTDPSGRKVVLSHSGAFAKYVGRLDLMVHVPSAEEVAANGNLNGAEVVSHDYRVLPVDGLWCDDAMRKYYQDVARFWAPGEFLANADVRRAMAACGNQEDRLTTELLQPYILGMDYGLQLTSIFAYAPKDVTRRNNNAGGDSPLGNLTADSMRKRRNVDVEMALTNTLGIRDNLYAGVITQESMFNVFPFENTINRMYLSGTEVQEMLDFVAERSASRGCAAQAQISGARFTMDCVQVQLNDLRFPCDPQQGGANMCPGTAAEREGHNPWQCLESDLNGYRCYANPAYDISINGKALDKHTTYAVAVNDYIAKGGSGFNVLKRNTTRFETGISLRDSLIGYMQGLCSCDEILAGATTSKTGEYCGVLTNGHYEVDTATIGACQTAKAFKDALSKKVGSCTCGQLLQKGFDPTGCNAEGVATAADAQAQCDVPAGPYTGRCSCKEALTAGEGTESACGFITPQLKQFCQNPTSVAVAPVVEDGRIGRRVK